jgi:homoserine O-acetyltransferase/O-succinyltransferase
MNASPGADPATAGAPIGIATREGIVEVPGGLALHHGGQLPGARIAWRLVGPPAAPVVCALGSTGTNRCVWTAEGAVRGWWSDVVGPGRALDVNRYRILSMDYLGGSGESSSPQAGESFPSISTYDQAEALLLLIEHMGLPSVSAVVGGSYGGMVALAFGERYPERVSHLVVMCAVDRPHPLATAWRCIERRIVRLAIAAGRGSEGVALARALVLSTSRSAEEFAARFAPTPVLEDERFVFPIEKYLLSQGERAAAHDRPEAFLCLSESMDLHNVDATRIFVPTTVVGVREDQRVPLTALRALVARLGAATFHEISSLYGHEGFLRESEQLRGIFATALEPPRERAKGGNEA